MAVAQQGGGQHAPGQGPFDQVGVALGAGWWVGGHVLAGGGTRRGAVALAKHHWLSCSTRPHLHPLHITVYRPDEP